MKTNIEYIKKKTKYGFIGMNKDAAAAHKIPYQHKHPEHTILIYHNVPKDVRTTTEHHEEMERYLMHTKHYCYKHAHKLALKFEDKNKPFPTNHIKQRLKQMGVKTR